MKRFTSYALVGSGRLARHLKFYLRELNLPTRYWSRNGDPDFNSGGDLARVAAESSHLLFAVRDSAIEDLAAPWRGSGKTLVHFSGALHSDFVAGAHPLMTFSGEPESLAWYQRIPFVVEPDSPLADLLPGLPNSSFALSSTADRSLYHALVSLAGNSTHLLWETIGGELARLGLPREILVPFLQQVAVAACEKQGGFTGPVARRDWATVASHLHALSSNPLLLESYKNYLQLARQTDHPVPEVLL